MACASACRVRQSIYAPLGPICLEHQDLCRGYSALGPSRVPPIYFYGPSTTSSSRHEEPGESRAAYATPVVGCAREKCYRKHAGEMGGGRNLWRCSLRGEGTSCETRSELEETTRPSNRVSRAHPCRDSLARVSRINDAYTYRDGV